MTNETQEFKNKVFAIIESMEKRYSENYKATAEKESSGSNSSGEKWKYSYAMTEMSNLKRMINAIKMD